MEIPTREDIKSQAPHQICDSQTLMAQQAVREQPRAELQPSPAARQKVRGTARRPFVLTSTHEKILQGVQHFRYMTRSDVQRDIYLSKSDNYVGALLRDLVVSRYLYRFLMPHTGAGACDYVYVLGARGRSHLRELGMEADWYFRPSETAQLSYLHLSHALALTRFLIAAERFVRGREDVQLFKVRTEYELKHEVPKVRVPLPSGDNQSREMALRVVPDAWLDFHFPQGSHRWRPVLVEIDRATEEQKHFKRKLRALLQFISPGGGYREVFGTSAVTIAIATTGSDKRVAQILSWIQDILTSLQQTAYADLFRVCGLPSELDETELFQAPTWRRPFEKTPMTLLD